MAKFQFVKATTSQTVLLFIQDSSSTTGAGLTGLTSASGSLTAYYYREGAGTGATVITLVAVGALGTWESGGFFQVDATDMPGWYELGIPNDCLAAGADFVGIQLKGAANMAQNNLEIQLTDFDLNDGVRGALTALPNAAADAAGGLPISDAGELDLDAMNTNINDIETDTDEIGEAGAGLTNINLPNQTMDIVGSITGNLSGSVGSVAGNVDGSVASVAGAVGSVAGNVDGSVASVTGAVGSVAGNVDGNVDGTVAGVTPATAANVNTEVLDVLQTDTFAQVGREAPAATQSVLKMLQYLYKAWRNKSTQTATQYDLYNDDAATLDQKATVSDDDTTATRGEIATGP
jgi:hypothetical protein